MRTIPLLLIYLVFSFYLNAQSLYSTTFYGGENNAGMINKFIPATNDLTVSKSLENFETYPYYTNFIQATDGKLYGMISAGGYYNNGVIFTYDPASSSYTVIYNFDGVNGAIPYGSLLLAADGKLYGMTNQGGATNEGVIFSYDLASLTYTKLMDFGDANGSYPTGSLIQAKDGKLYGMTTQGGSITSSGVVFSFDPSLSSYRVLKAFDFSDNPGFDNANPQGRLLEASDGKLYGLASLINGFIFSYDPSSETYTKLKDFDTANGINPYGSLIQAGNGKLYGMTKSGGSSGDGVIFSYNPQDTSLQKLKDFDGINGSYPFGDLIDIGKGKFYGMTSHGGTRDAGTIFSFDLSANIVTKLKDFDSTTGGYPEGSLLKATDGKLYGMTTFGSPSNKGTIFSFDLKDSVFTDLKDFGTNKTGSNISASLLLASDKKLYGMTHSGGSNGYGIIFSYDPATFIYTNLKNFTGSDGASPYGSLIQASDGKLYGMTSAGGNFNYGVIFSFDPASVAYTKLTDFNFDNGASPYGSLMQPSNGLLYGVTREGGVSPSQFPGGVIFSYDPINNLYTRLYNLDLKQGGNPTGSLIQNADGRFYGLNSTVVGNSFGGGIFSFNPVTNVYKQRCGFDESLPNGITPFGSFIKAKDNKLYATTSGGGSNGYGIIFSYDPSVSLTTYSKLYDFSGVDGAYSLSNLLQAADGNLYGITNEGGIDNVGSVFSYDPSSSTFTHLADFNGVDGANPYFGSAFIEVPDAGPLALTIISFTGKNIPGNNQLTWKIVGDEIADFYDLQRSADAQNFTSIVHLQASGNNAYKYNDKMFNASYTYYYRLKSIDKLGNISYSNVVKIDAQIKSDFVLVNPNPFKESLMVTVTTSSQESAMFILTDVTGKRLFQETKQLYKGANVSRIDETKRLAKGTYLLTIITPSQLQTIKVVKDN